MTTECFDKYDFSGAISEIMNFTNFDLSTFYLDISKDILYCEDKSSLRRRQVQTVLYRVGEALLRILNPILPFTMDEFNNNLPGKRSHSVQLLDYPSYKDEDKKLLEEYDSLLALRSEVLKALEEARNNRVIGSSQEALVYINKNNELLKVYSLSELASICVVSEVKVSEDDSARVIHHPGVKCDRCWNYSDEVSTEEDGSHLCHRCQEVVHHHE